VVQRGRAARDGRRRGGVDGVGANDLRRRHLRAARAGPAHEPDRVAAGEQEPGEGDADLAGAEDDV
jgi:hypothetical protein